MNKNNLLISIDKINEKINRIYQSPKELITNSLSLAILTLAVIALAFSPIFTKLSETEISPTATIFNRLWIATIIMSCWQLIKTPPEFKPTQLLAFAPDYKQQGLLILASLTATTSSLFWAISLTQTSVASSTILRSLTPLFISLGAWLILKQKFNSKFILGMLIAIVGATVIAWDDLQLGTNHLLGDGIALLSAALHGGNILTVGYLRDRDCDTAKIVLWRCAWGTLIILPIVFWTHTQLFPVSAQGWLVVIALAVVCQTFGKGLLVYSLKNFSSSFVGIFALLKPIITAILAWLIFTENLSLVNALAVILTLTGIYLAKSSDSAKTSSQSKT